MTWRVIGIASDGQPFSNSGFRDRQTANSWARDEEKRRTIFAVVMKNETRLVYDKYDLIKNMQVVEFKHHEWLWRGEESLKAYRDWLATQSEYGEGIVLAQSPAPRKPEPQIRPEVWVDKEKFANVDYMAAVRAMCGEGRD